MGPGRPSVPDVETTSSRPSVPVMSTTTGGPSVPDIETTSSRPSVPVVSTTTGRPSVPDVEKTTTITNAIVDAYMTTTKVERPYCPFQYFDLQYATNPCMISSCEIHIDGEVCREAVAVYCNRSMAEKGYVEAGCVQMTIKEIEKAPTTTTTVTTKTTTKTTSVTASPSIPSTTTAVPSYCPYKYSDLMVKNPCILDVCNDTSHNAECKDGIVLYCNESKYRKNGEVEQGCISIVNSSYVATTTTLPSDASITTGRPYVPGIETTSSRPYVPVMSKTTGRPSVPDIETTSSRPYVPVVSTTTGRPSVPVVSTTSSRPYVPVVSTTTGRPSVPDVKTTS